MNATHLCPICSSVISVNTSRFTRYCQSCDYWGGDLVVDIESSTLESEGDEINDEQYISSLDTLRAKNFAIILDEIAVVTGVKKLSILDVGCASGSFMRSAIARGHVVKGVEPNKPLCDYAQRQGLDVIGDYFPPRVAFEQKFDLIIFNDVFEHIPDINAIIEACRANLYPDGVLVLNLPNSDGLIFRVAKVLATMGVSGPWERLWQVMFKTPHLHYFNFKSLNKLLNKHGYKPVTDKKEIPTLQIEGTWSRLLLDRSLSGLIKNTVLYLGLLVLYPFIRVAQKDTFFVVYKSKR